MTAPELKPCPFCGGKAQIVSHRVLGDAEEAYVFCKSCDAHGEHYEDAYAPISDAIAAWNRRADLAAVPAQVRVKPLVWEDDTDRDSDDFGRLIATDTNIHVRYKVYRGYGGDWLLSGSVPFWLPRYPTEEAAKAAAQADYEARILAALEPQSDPRDEVIARLVEAVQVYVSRSDEYNIIPTDRGGSHGPKGKAFIAVGDAYIAMSAALAAAKAVRDDDH